MGICLVSGASLQLIAASAFTLSWTHSVERVEWQEDWRLTGDRLAIVEARIKGSGAGMEPPDDARLRDGWWTYRPRVEPPEIRLANSGGRAGHWRICGDDRCISPAASTAGDLIIRPCDKPDAPG